MTRWTLSLALFLLVLGVVAWLATGRQSVTALIPSFLGLPLLLAGLAARTERRRPVALGAAALLALVGLGGTAGGLVKTVRLLGGGSVERPEAAVVQAAVAIACLLYLVRGAIHLARRRRAGAASAQA